MSYKRIACIGSPEDFPQGEPARLFAPLMTALMAQGRELSYIPYSDLISFSKESVSRDIIDRTECILFFDFWNLVAPNVLFQFGDLEQAPKKALHFYNIPEWFDIQYDYEAFVLQCYDQVLSGVKDWEINVNDGIEYITFPKFPVNHDRPETPWANKIYFILPWLPRNGTHKFLEFVQQIRLSPFGEQTEIGIINYYEESDLIPKHFIDTGIKVLPKTTQWQDLFKDGGYVWGFSEEHCSPILDAVSYGASPLLLRDTSDSFQFLPEAFKYSHPQDALERMARQFVFADEDWRNLAAYNASTVNLLADTICGN